MKDKRNLYPTRSMKIKTTNNLSTTDKLIRLVLKDYLKIKHLNDDTVRIIEELGIKHGTVRADIAVVNGVLHGYEIKSDQDTLLRLPEQIAAYNEVFNEMTIVVGLSHLYDVINIVPNWWGVTVARFNQGGELVLHCIREGEKNTDQDAVSVARLLWRKEALGILEELNEAQGVRSKPRTIVYEKLVASLSNEALQTRVRQTLCFRSEWRADQQLLTNGGLRLTSATTQ